MASKALTGDSLGSFDKTCDADTIFRPQILLPLSAIVAALVDYCVTLGLTLLAMLGYGFYPSVTIVALIPIALFTIALVLGLSLWLKALSGCKELAYLMLIWLIISPILYSSTMLPADIVPYMALNPLVLLIDSTQWALLNTPLPGILEFLISSLAVVALLISGVWMCTRLDAK
jgi:lipopolysaccharide transport system permease protein